MNTQIKHTNEALIVAFGEKTVEVNLFSDFWSVIKDKVFNSEFKKQSHGQEFTRTNMTLKPLKLN
jgi:hypothetical protein